MWIKAYLGDEGEIIRAFVDFDITTRLRQADVVRAFHIHSGRAGTNGPVVINPMIRPIDRERPGNVRVFRQVAA